MVTPTLIDGVSSGGVWPAAGVTWADAGTAHARPAHTTAAASDRKRNE
jgi:hypothetical protein